MIRFGRQEVRDLLIAWVVLGFAFTIFFAGGGTAIRRGGVPVELFLVSLLTAGVGFLLHELAHKVVAIHFGQRAQFRADYNMLVVAVLSALVGFLFAAPGAVHHHGTVTDREHGLIAVAGPATNVGLTGLFLAIGALPGFQRLASFGILVNAFLAAFNMLPVGGLDGRTVLRWSWLAFGATIAGCVGLLLWALDRIPLETLL